LLVHPDRLNSGTLAALGLALVVPVFVHSFYSYYLYVKALEELKTHAKDMGALFDSTLSTLALAIDAKDKHTHGHTQRVQKYARAIAEAMKLDSDHIKAIEDAALLHDIGKLAIPEYILSKRGPLTPEETRKMRMHPQLGVDIISNIKFPYPVADSILAHHERYDGQGYPKGLRGHDIPLGARVLAVADAFDGYISEHPEGKESLDRAIRWVHEGSAAAFDPEIVTVWEKICPDIVGWSSKVETASYTGIQQAKSELRMLELLSASIEGLTSVQEIFLTVRARLMKCITGSTISLDRGEREGIPVVFSEKVIATISVTRAQIPLNEDEFRLLHAVATTIAPALHNAMAIEEIRREATVDKLTGLSNRRAFEMMTASLNRQHFSIVLIDVNYFKAVNDNFGHNTGDATLVRIAAHLRVAFHDAQLTCRLGGDEFLVLSFADLRTLRSQIRRFRHMVVWDPAHDAFKPLLFGVSCGVASIPGDSTNIEQALECADLRMYAIKMRYKQRCARFADLGAMLVSKG